MTGHYQPKLVTLIPLKKVRYPHNSRLAYLKKADAITYDPATKSSVDYPYRNVHIKVFTQISDYVRTFIINGKQSEMLTSVHQRYLSSLVTYGDCDTSYSA